MAVRVSLPAALVAAGWGTPTVCVRHGRPMARTKRIPFRAVLSTWSYVLLVVGVAAIAGLGGWIMLLVGVGLIGWAITMPRRVIAPAWPFCVQCLAGRRRRLIIGVGLMVLAAVVTGTDAVVESAGSRGASLVFVGMLVLFGIGVGLTARGSNVTLAGGVVAKDLATVEFARAHPDFAEQATAARQAADQQAAADQHAARQAADQQAAADQHAARQIGPQVAQLAAADQQAAHEAALLRAARRPIDPESD